MRGTPTVPHCGAIAAGSVQLPSGAGREAAVVAVQQTLSSVQLQGQRRRSQLPSTRPPACPPTLLPQAHLGGVDVVRPMPVLIHEARHLHERMEGEVMERERMERESFVAKKLLGNMA